VMPSFPEQPEPELLVTPKATAAQRPSS
jgi:hypothetical protein